MKPLAGCLLYWVMVGFGIVAFAFAAKGWREGSPVNLLVGLAFAVATAGVFKLIDRHNLVD